jgi:hypothetical protein
VNSDRDDGEGSPEGAARTWLLGHLSELATLADEGGWRVTLDAEVAAFRAGRPALDTLRHLGLDTTAVAVGAPAPGTLWIRVPDDLMTDLTDAEAVEAHARQPGSVRGVIEDALTISSIGANLTALVLARDQLGAFIASVRNWMTRRTPPEAGAEFTAEITARHGDDHYNLRLTCRRGAAGQPPQLNADALTALLASMLDDEA